MFTPSLTLAAITPRSEAARSATVMAVAASLLGVTPAAASPMDAFRTAIERFAETHGAVRAEMLDLNRNGLVEVLLVQDDPCGPDGCAWSLLAQGAGIEEVASGVGLRIDLVSTEPSGGLLEVDGVTWALIEGGLFPFGDAIGLSLNRATASRELRAIQALPGFSDVALEDIRTWSFTYPMSGQIQNAHVHVIMTWDLQVGTWGSPYVVLDNDGGLLLEGVSTDVPRIFPALEGDGFTVVDVVPAGFQIRVVGAADPDTSTSSPER